MRILLPIFTGQTLGLVSRNASVEIQDVQVYQAVSCDPLGKILTIQRASLMLQPVGRDAKQFTSIDRYILLLCVQYPMGLFT
jgi:hypothetical protein